MKGIYKKHLFKRVLSEDSKPVYEFLFKKIVGVLAEKYGVPIREIPSLLQYFNNKTLDSIGQAVEEDFKEQVFEKWDACYFCLSKKDLEIHHLQSKADNPEVKYDLDNVVLLCHDCHQEYHNIKEKK